MTPMEQAMTDALALSLENDQECESILRLALPHFERFHRREMEMCRLALTMALLCIEAETAVDFEVMDGREETLDMLRTVLES
jgi:hypothetical protein